MTYVIAILLFVLVLELGYLVLTFGAVEVVKEKPEVEVVPFKRSVAYPKGAKRKPKTHDDRSAALKEIEESSKRSRV